MRSYKAEWRKNRQSPLAHGNETQSSISSCFYSSTQKRSNIAKDRPHGVDQKFVPILRVCVRDRATRSEFPISIFHFQLFLFQYSKALQYRQGSAAWRGSEIRSNSASLRP